MIDIEHHQQEEEWAKERDGRLPRIHCTGRFNKKCAKSIVAHPRELEFQPKRKTNNANVLG
jgi:hypothetical protein